MSDDEREAKRELDTIPAGLEPPPSFVGTPPERIPGAPAWVDEFLHRVEQKTEEAAASREEEKTLLRKVLANQEMMVKQFTTHRAETRARLNSHEVELEHVRSLGETRDEQLMDHQVRLERLESRVDEHITEHVRVEDDGK